MLVGWVCPVLQAEWKLNALEVAEIIGDEGCADCESMRGDQQIELADCLTGRSQEVSNFCVVFGCGRRPVNYQDDR